MTAGRFGSLERYQSESADSGPVRSSRKRGSVPVQPAGKCYCGCGTATAITTRSRLVVCFGCGMKLRLSRKAMAETRIKCAECDCLLEPWCDDDAARAGFEHRARALEARIAESMSAADVARGRVSDDKAWWEARKPRRSRTRLPNTPVSVLPDVGGTPSDMPF